MKAVSCPFPTITGMFAVNEHITFANDEQPGKSQLLVDVPSSLDRPEQLHPRRTSRNEIAGIENQVRVSRAENGKLIGDCGKGSKKGEWRARSRRGGLGGSGGQ